VQQTHLVWAATSQRWVLFYIRDSTPTQVLTMLSPDFTTWTPGQTLALTHTIAGVGRELSVAYRTIGVNDVVHVAMSHEIAANERRHTHARGIVQGDTIAFTTPEDVSLAGNTITGVDPDAPATLVTAGGTVYDATGFTAYGDAGSFYNANVFVAKNADDGSATYATGGWTRVDLELTKRHVNSRAFIEVQGIVGAFWDSADVKPSPTDAHGSVNAGSWSAPMGLWDAGGGMNENEWSLTTSGPTAHAVRMTTAGVFQHLVGAPALVAGGTVPAIAASPTGGALLLSDATAPTLYVLATDNSIQASRYASNAWSAWTVVVPASIAGRAYLSGYAGNGHRALVWTQVSSGGYEIDGVALH